MKSTHVGMKTSYVYEGTGTLWPFITRAYYVKELKQDLLGGSALNAAKYRVIIDEHEEIAGYMIQSETMELLMQRRVSLLLVSTREACFVFGPNQNMVI